MGKTISSLPEKTTLVDADNLVIVDSAVSTDKTKKITALTLKNYAGGAGGSGTVTNVSSADSNATVATQTTTPVITIVSAPKLLTARTISGVSFNGTANIIIPDYFILTFWSGTLNPADATSYFFLHGTIVPTTTAANHTMTAPFNFTVVGAIVRITSNTVAGTTETSTLKINNITTAVSSSVGTFTSDGSTTVCKSTTITGVSILVTSGDSFTMEWLSATWVTNPTGARITVDLICTKP